MNGSEFQELWRYIAELEKRVKVLEAQHQHEHPEMDSILETEIDEILYGNNDKQPSDGFAERNDLIRGEGINYIIP